MIWFPSLDSLEGVASRGDGPGRRRRAAIVVCRRSPTTTRARQLGADRCAVHPLTYAEFSASLAAVGLRTGATAHDTTLIEPRADRGAGSSASRD